MKQKFYSILLTALLGMFGMNAWALSTTTIDGKTYNMQKGINIVGNKKVLY